jgi:hypothetical protein
MRSFVMKWRDAYAERAGGMVTAKATDDAP